MTVSEGMRERLAEQGEASMREVIDQRDLARRCAVALEQECHALEIERDALLLAADPGSHPMEPLGGNAA